MLTLWDLIEPVARVLRQPSRKPPTQPAPTQPAPTQPAPAKPAPTQPAPAKLAPVKRARPRPAKTAARRPSAAERYEALVRELLAEHNIRVRKWRSGSSGIAVVLRYRDGSVRRYIECPRPRGPMSVAIALHEIGHHVLGVGAISPRCLEEWAAWDYALRTMEARGVPITDRVRRRVDRSLRYAVAKARRRGLRDLPAQLAPYAEPRRPAA
ncbi:MAG: hypothetical protein SFY69_11255 [Planctomycetota bacterium]|nr:hypothetical protein [Planctomycetota bacterium]